MAACMVWDQGQGSGQLRLGCEEGRCPIGHIQKYARKRVHARRSNKRIDVVGVGGQRAIEKASRLRQIVWVYALVEPSRAA